MSGQSDPTIQQIISLHSEDNYNAIIYIFRDAAFAKTSKTDIANLHLVTWPLPSEKDLAKFAQFIVQNQIHRIFSIGCGTGLLEWLMLKYIQKEHQKCASSVETPRNDMGCETELIGIEVDSRWWNSSYSPPKFIPLKFYDEDFDLKGTFGCDNDLAIFCYFNNIQIFNDYLSHFCGQFVVLIGPISHEQFCAPGPKDLAENHKELPTQDWEMIECEQFGFIGIDHLAIYRRKLQQEPIQ